MKQNDRERQGYKDRERKKIKTEVQRETEK